MPRVVAFTGMPGSGKTVAVEAARRIGLPVFRMGDAVWDEVRSRGLQLEEGAVGRIATEMREKHGPGVWAERVVERIRKSDASTVVIDGVRSPEEVDVFRALLGPEFTLVALHAAPGVRMRRLLARGREDDVKDESEFRARDTRELSWGIGKAIALADVMLVNEGDMTTVERQVAALFARESS